MVVTLVTIVYKCFGYGEEKYINYTMYIIMWNLSAKGLQFWNCIFKIDYIVYH